MLPTEAEAIRVRSRMAVMHSSVEQIKELFLPEVQHLASEMRQQCPKLRFNVWHDSVGSRTAYQGYSLGVECVFQRVAADVSDNVALCIDLCNLTTTPRLMADVAWGHPSGYCEAAFRDNCQTSSDWPEVTQGVVEELRTKFPMLVRAFQSAVERGSPPVPPAVDYSGMTVNERLFSAGVMADWDSAAISRNRKCMIELLGRVGLAEHAEKIADTILSNPERYGF